MRFQIPTEIVPKLRELQAQPKQHFTAETIDAEDAVLMTLDLRGARYLTFDGRVIIHDYMLGKPPREAKDATEMYSAVFGGANQRYAPELLSLLPSRPKAAVDCVACGNRGWLFFDPDGTYLFRIICSECGGVGWKGGDENLFEVA